MTAAHDALPGQVALFRIEANGFPDPFETILSLGQLVADAGSDDLGRVMLYLGHNTGRHYFARPLPYSPVLDTSFGSDGIDHFPDRPCGDDATTRFEGIGPDGRAYLISRGTIEIPSGPSYQGVLISMTPYE